MSMKKKSKMIWCIFAVCVIVAIILRLAMEAQKLEYKEVQVRVISAETKHIQNRRLHTTYDIREVKAAYKDKVYELGNVYNTNLYTPGEHVKAYLSNGRLYANIEGVSTSTPLAKVYFVFLFGSFGLLILGFYYWGKARDEQISANESKNSVNAD